ncbi:hypothetical protein Adu01nite_86350 [Paractinoplanes durhamensis]|uniref:Uncharacterized protein n=1 Tax=Paractinoplanes durhamensis TaxID=113563 RepID=A0ABQ3ZBT1_9ACTN|nr:hypothetical protein Adu01nite_86350 [Actinoplanes durhamensis]
MSHRKRTGAWDFQQDNDDLSQTLSDAMAGRIDLDLLTIRSRRFSLNHDDPRRILTVKILVPHGWHESCDNCPACRCVMRDWHLHSTGGCGCSGGASLTA